MIAIGSLPWTEPDTATRLMLEAFPEVASWPQLPERDFRENMYAQYSEGMPGIRIDSDAGRVWFQVDESLPGELEDFYQAVVDEDLERFRISPEYASGLAHLTGGAFAKELTGRRYVKGHMTGPVSFGLTVTDQNRRASIYDETLEQAIIKALTLKGAWQSRELRRAAPGARVVMFYDEPYLHSVGSALISVSRGQVMADIGECLRGCGADVTGIHCCGNTDWAMVFATGVDVVHFDAFEYMEPFIAYVDDIARHLERGGSLAWGIVPKDEAVFDVSADRLVGSLEEAFDTLAAGGIDRELLARRSLVSPSCGLGPASIKVAERALELTRQVSEAMRERYPGDVG